MEAKLSLVNVPRIFTDKQVYMQSFCEAWIAQGGCYVERNGWLNSRIARNILKMIAVMRFPAKKGNKTFLVCSRGGHLLKAVVPYMFQGEIIPMLWDCWPSTWNRLERDLKLIKCRLCFVTASDVVREFSRRLPYVHFVHVPEGVDVHDYTEGKQLKERGIDVYELGAKNEYFHKKLLDEEFGKSYKWVYSQHKPPKGLDSVYDKWETFTSVLADTKIIISFPRCMRNSEKYGCVATLTMRYWEAMLSRCIIVGHGPKELIDIIGYNPVVEADFVNPCKQIKYLLSHIEEYQPLVDKNFSVARQYAPWNVRMSLLFAELQDYQFRS